jgi:hypothetical protein
MDQVLPSWPTSAHWYDRSRFRRYMAAHIAHSGDVTVREFVREFDGMRGTAKKKAVLAEIGASHVSLHDFFGRHKVNNDNITKLLVTLQRHSKPVRPAQLGVIGKAHFYRMMEVPAAVEDVQICRDPGETDGIPRVVEFAFSVHRDGLAAFVDRPQGHHRRELVSGIGNPFRQLAVAAPA